MLSVDGSVQADLDNSNFFNFLKIRLELKLELTQMPQIRL